MHHSLLIAQKTTPDQARRFERKTLSIQDTHSLSARDISTTSTKGRETKGIVIAPSTDPALAEAWLSGFIVD